jgi:hypothetical protein
MSVREWLAAVLLVIPSLASAQMAGQSFEVIPETNRATVGDIVTLRFRARLDERDLLFDTVPQPLATLPSGIRLLSVEKLTRAPDRIFNGRARLAFYRPGKQAIPTFGLPFMRAVKGVGRATLPSDSASVEISALLPAGNPSLKDIRELAPQQPSRLLPIAIVAAAGALLIVFLRRRRRRRGPRVEAQPEPVLPPPAPDPYSVALDALHRLERSGWPSKGRVDRHYEAAVDVLRNYLEVAESIDARERTTEELVWSLPPHLSSAGLRDQLRYLLYEADLVKFARLRPDPADAARFLQGCRVLLTDWHAAVPAGEPADAVR